MGLILPLRLHLRRYLCLVAVAVRLFALLVVVAVAVSATVPYQGLAAELIRVPRREREARRKFWRSSRELGQCLGRLVVLRVRCRGMLLGSRGLRRIELLAMGEQGYLVYYHFVLNEFGLGGGDGGGGWCFLTWSRQVWSWVRMSAIMGDRWDYDVERKGMKE